VPVVGRAADDNTDDEENDVFLDAALQLHANQHLLHRDETLRDLEIEVSAYTGPSDVNTPEGRIWKARSEYMRHIAVARYAAKLQIWEDVLEGINVFCMTVDCFLQIQSDTSMLSEVFAPLGHGSGNLRRGTSSGSSEGIRCVPSCSDCLHVRRPTGVLRVVSLG
jgi:hypothetical protein